MSEAVKLDQIIYAADLPDGAHVWASDYEGDCGVCDTESVFTVNGKFADKRTRGHEACVRFWLIQQGRASRAIDLVILSLSL